MRPYILPLVLTIAGCATATEMYGPEGERLVSIDCSGAAMQMSACYEKAAEVCPRGYRLVERSSETGPLMASGGAGYPFALSQAQYRSIIVECK